MFVFDLTDILGNKISRISNVRRGNGNPLPAGAIYDYNTGILQVYEPGRLPDILYDYDVQHTGDRDKPMDVKVSLDYPAQIVVFRAGSKDYYSTGETVALAARAEGGTPPYRYSFVAARSDGTETILRDYAYSNVFNWKPTTPDSYLLTVSVLDANDRWDIRNRYIWVTAGLRIAVFRTGNKTSYSTGETVALAARAEDGATPYRYQFYVVRSNGSKVILRKFASSNVFNWTPTTPDNYRVGVEVKDANGLTVSEEKNVTVTASEPLEVAVFRAGSKTTYAPGESVALAARGEGGTAPYRYQFYVYRSNGARVILKNYSYSNIFTWKPVSLDTYRICVAIRDARGKVITKALYVTVKKK
ncbi:MAG: hypothetical protein QM296_00395 [Bacillota bacterium]|nr:hypothetical protein [Bacillota bacterium]